MSRVLVTGGTGVLGSRVVTRLVDRGHEVGVLSRRDRPPGAGARSFRGELRSGDGLDAAARGVDAIVHCASSPLWRDRATEVRGLRNLIAAAAPGRPHLVYISIVGVDRIPYYYYYYYRAKWEAERVIETCELPWTILRATQFHSLVDRYTLGPLAAAPAGARVQLIDAGEVAERLVELVDAGASGRVGDMGGPEILSMHDVARLRREGLGKRLRVVELPAVGRTARAFADGLNLCPERAVGRITYEEYLRGPATAAIAEWGPAEDWSDWDDAKG